ncbi:hypothetical protein ACFPMF_01010 [Larkinella bovis]|uniref:DUF4595 domain-containing protein n=1 Tax=Larkinella bovis TaxID=683041 RepID=A0ABW0I5R2_9BACT
MQLRLRSLLGFGFVLLFGSCSLKDHIVPQSSSCEVREINYELDYYKIPNGQTVNIGDIVTGLFTTFPVMDIITINGSNYAVGGPEYSTHYTYGPDGRVKRSHTSGRSLSNGIFIHEYSYAPNKVTDVYKQWMKTFPDTLVTTQVYNLNSDGVAIRDNITYTNGYVTEERFESYTHTYTLQNGNTIKRVWTAKPGGGFDGLPPRTTDYEFDVTAPNPIPTLFPYLGKPNQNKMIKEYDRDGNARLDYQYIFDAEGHLNYVIRILIRSNEPDRYLITGYKQDCPTSY